MGGTYESAASDAGGAAPKPTNATRPHPSPGAGLSSAPGAPTPRPPTPRAPTPRAPTPRAPSRPPAASSAVSAAAWPSVRPAARSDGAQPGGPKAAAPADPAPPQPSSEPPPQRRIQDQMDRFRARERATEKAVGAQKALATAPQPQQPQQPRRSQQPQRPPRLSDEDEAELARTAAAMNRTSDIRAFEPIARGALEAEPAKALRELHRLGEQLTDPRVRGQLDRMIEGALRPKAGAQALAARQAGRPPAAPQPAKSQPAAPQPAAPPTLAPDAKFVFTSAVDEAAEASGPDAPQSDWFDEATGKAAAWALDKAADVGRAVGLDHAADNLDHFLEGSGQDPTLTREEARTRGPVIEGERTNQKRFEEHFTVDRSQEPQDDGSVRMSDYEYRSHLLAMKDGDVLQLPKGPDKPGEPRDHWDRETDRGDNLLRLDLDEALATGRSKVRSSAPNGFTATRTGDTITLHGEVEHDWSDAYDFHDGSDGWIGAPARDHGGAREFENSAEWRQTLTATFKIVGGELVPQDFVWRDLD